MSAPPLDLEAITLTGRHVIEASAGTGKTHSIAKLYGRLLREKNLSVDCILVVTYTRASCADLKKRLQSHIAEELSGLDPQASGCKNLKRALLEFDRAAIFTFDAFCQRTLREYAHLVGLPPQWSVLPDMNRLDKEIAADFWRREIRRCDDVFVRALADYKIHGPESLLEELEERKPTPANDLWPAAVAALERAWRACGRSGYLAEVILKLKDPAFNKGRTKPSLRVARQLQKELRHDELLILMPKDLDRLTTAHITSPKYVCKNQIPPPIDLSLIDDLHAALQNFMAAYEQSFNSWLYQFKQDLEQERLLRKQRLGEYTFHDQKVLLSNLLQGPHSASVVRDLRKQYQAVLMDESQDTDEEQFTTLDALFPPQGEAPVYLVGDPKQSIYEFRGADINAYFANTADVVNRYRLPQNYRSAPALLRCINSLFDQQKSFRHEGIDFHPMQPSGSVRDGQLREMDAPWPAVRLWVQRDTEVNSTARQLEVSRSVAAQLAAWIRQPPHLMDGLLQARDIAVLTRTNAQAGLMQQTLAELGVDCSMQMANTSVLEESACHHWQRVLRALADEQNYGALILATVWWDGAKTKPDDAAHAKLLADFAQIFVHQGPLPLWSALMNISGAWERVLAGGERFATDLAHIAELLQKKYDELGADVLALLRYLQQPDTASEEQQVRIASDRNLIQVQTIHRAKGLQFPLVVCPFLWDVDENKSEGDGNDDESRRLLYVAVTRAQYHLAIVWREGKASGQSALGQLLAHADTSSSDIFARWRALSGDALVQTNLPPITVRPTAQQTFSLVRQGTSDHINVRRFSRSSYSAWVKGAAAEEDWMTPPDRTSTASALDFPSGKEAGSCLHAILQSLPFTEPARWNDIILRQLRKSYIEEKYLDTLRRWLENLVDWPFFLAQGTPFRLSNLQHEIREMEFVLPHSQFVIPADFIDGTIDLIFMHEDRWYVLDYKSNVLPSYEQEEIDRDVLQHRYDLQVQLYSLALHRRLQIAQRDYDYQRHFGGAIILYLRGCDKDRQALYFQQLKLDNPSQPLMPNKNYFL